MDAKGDFLFVNRFANPRYGPREQDSGYTVVQRFVQRKARHKIQQIQQPRCHVPGRDIRDAVLEVNIERDSGNVPGEDTFGLRANDNNCNSEQDSVRLVRLGSHALISLHRPDGSGKDPFQVSPIVIDADIEFMLYYFATIIDPPLWMWSKKDSSYRRHNDELRQGQCSTVKEAFQDELSMYCLLSVAATQLYHSDGLLFGKRPDRQIEFIGRALSLMQRKVAHANRSPRGDFLSLFEHMVFLTAAEAHGGNPWAAAQHFRASLNLLTRNGMSMADVERDNLRGMVVILDQYFGNLYLQRYLYPYERLSVSDLALRHGEMRTLIPDFEKMGTGFLSDDLVSQDLKHIITEIKETYSIQQCLNTEVMSEQRVEETALWLRGRYRAHRADLFSPYEISRADISISGLADVMKDESIDLALRVSLTLFTFMVHKVRKVLRFGDVHTPRLRAYVEVLLNENIGGCRHLLLWSLMVGFCCTRPESEIATWFEHKLTELMLVCDDIRDGVIDDGEKLLGVFESFQVRYLYSAYEQRGHMLRLVRTFKERLGGAHQR